MAFAVGMLHCELVSNKFLDLTPRLSPAQADELKRRGWEEPADVPNWSRDVPLAQTGHIAYEMQRALHEVYGVAASDLTLAGPRQAP